jgi:hypothetical protein
MCSAALLLSVAASAAATRVTKDQWQAEAQNALEAAKPLWSQGAESGCVLTISGKRVTTTSDSPLKLCRVDHGGDVDASKTVVLAMVDSTQYLEKKGNWEAFLNKAAYCRRTKRALYLWLGVPSTDILDARHAAPWATCRDRREGNTLNGVKTLGFLALFEGPHPPSSILYVDADAWFSDVAFSSERVTPEAYLALSSDSELLGNQNRIGGPKIPMNGGLIFARRSQFTSQFFALWWRGRCGKKDQLPLWATLFAAWSASSNGAYDFDSSLFDRYAVAHNKRGALHVLQRDAARIRAQNGITAFDGGNFRETGRLLEKPLALPHVLLLPSAPVASLPALRSDADGTRPTFVCHTRIDAVEHGGQCKGADVCARGKCAPFL